MKNIFRSLGVLTLLLALVGQSFATVYTVPGKVRYAIELKKMTAAEAQAAQTQGYVDLWAFAYFSQEFVDNGMIKLSADGSMIEECHIQFTSTTHAYKIIDKNGNLDKTGSIAKFAPKISCGSRPQQPVKDRYGNQNPTFVSGSCCPTWFYGASGAPTDNVYDDPPTPRRMLIVEEGGEKWYAVRLYQIRYEYFAKQSFYTSFYTEDISSGDPNHNACATSASTFSISLDGQDNPIHAPNWKWGDIHDWSFFYYRSDAPADERYRFDFIRGGVEIIADPEFTLVASATCGGSDLSGTFKVSNWNGKDWSDYTAARMYVNTTGGTRKDVSAQTTVTPSLPLGTASSTDNFTYSLSPSAYMVNGAPADSLIWAFEDAKTKLI